MPFRIELIGKTDNAQLFFGIQALNFFNNLSSGHFSNLTASERDNQYRGSTEVGVLALVEAKGKAKKAERRRKQGKAEVKLGIKKERADLCQTV